MGKLLTGLSERMRPLAEQLLKKATEAGLDPVIVETDRTIEQQEKYMKLGVSWTLHSKHLTGDAIDVAPRAVLALKNWAPLHPHWFLLGKIGKDLGLVWGGEWTKHKDNPHFEYREKEKEKEREQTHA